MADDARVLALKRLETLMAKERATRGTEEGRTCAALVLRIIETHGFKIVDPTQVPAARRSLFADALKDMAANMPRDPTPASAYPTGVSCVYCKKYIMFREQYTGVEGGIVHDRCFEGYETQRKHYKE